jgi:hypothetical protein
MRIMRMPSAVDLEPVSGLPYLFSSSWIRLSREPMWFLSCSITDSEDMVLVIWALSGPDRGDRDEEWTGGGEKGVGEGEGWTRW